MTDTKERAHRNTCPALLAWDIPGACNCDRPYLRAPRESRAKRKIRLALAGRGYKPREIVWNGSWVPIDFGADGGFSVDGFGAFASADEFVGWIADDENFAAFERDTEFMRDEDGAA
jgi:hypothetical protein